MEYLQRRVRHWCSRSIRTPYSASMDGILNSARLFCKLFISGFGLRLCRQASAGKSARPGNGTCGQGPNAGVSALAPLAAAPAITRCAYENLDRPRFRMAYDFSSPSAAAAGTAAGASPSAPAACCEVLAACRLAAASLPSCESKRCALPKRCAARPPCAAISRWDSAPIAAKPRLALRPSFCSSVISRPYPSVDPRPHGATAVPAARRRGLGGTPKGRGGERSASLTAFVLLTGSPFAQTGACVSKACAMPEGRRNPRTWEAIQGSHAARPFGSRILTGTAPGGMFSTNLSLNKDTLYKDILYKDTLSR